MYEAILLEKPPLNQKKLEHWEIFLTRVFSKSNFLENKLQRKMHTSEPTKFSYEMTKVLLLYIKPSFFLRGFKSLEISCNFQVVLHLSGVSTHFLDGRENENKRFEKHQRKV